MLIFEWPSVILKRIFMKRHSRDILLLTWKIFERYLNATYCSQSIQVNGGVMGIGIFLFACLIITVDQFSKRIVLHCCTRGAFESLWARHIITVRDGQRLKLNRYVLLALWGVAAFSIMFFAFHGPIFQRQVAQIGLAAAWGGAGGNLWDVFRRGAVVDFIDFGFWPVFNLADIAILLGLLVALCFAH